MRPPIRVCHLGKYYPPAPGGIETHVRILAQRRPTWGRRERIVCVNHEAGPTIEERDGPVEVTRFRRVARPSSSTSVPGWPPDCEGRGRHPAIQVPNPTMILALLAARPRQPVIVSYQSDVVRQGSARRCSGRSNGWPTAESG